MVETFIPPSKSGGGNIRHIRSSTTALFRITTQSISPCNAAMQPFRKPKLCQQLHHLFRFTTTLNLHLHQIKSLSTDSNDPKSSSPLPNPIDAGSSNRKPISLWPGMHHSPATHALWEARSTIFENTINGNSNSNDPHPKSPSQSRTSILYNFSSDLILREQYRNPWNHIRMGKLVEDFDALAGTIALKVFSFYEIELWVLFLTGFGTMGFDCFVEIDDKFLIFNVFYENSIVVMKMVVQDLFCWLLLLLIRWFLRNRFGLMLILLLLVLLRGLVGRLWRFNWK